jgi:CelD/BcsL family acetyltransferase involved in cellulose biosynthesis
VEIRAHTEPSVFEELQSEWNELLGQSSTDVIFLSCEWQSTWWHSYDAGDLWVVTCRDDSGQLIGIGPWFIEDHDGERVVRTIGCVDVTDYVDVIAHSSCVDTVLEYFARFLADHANQYDRINLCNIPENSATYTRFPDRLRQHHFEADMVLQEVCPVIHLPDEWEGYLAMLDKKQRHELRRKLRRAESETRIEWYIVGAEHNFDEEVGHFLALMAASQPSKAEFLSDVNNLRFFKQILKVTFEKGWLRLSLLKANGTYAAGYCDFDYKKHILVYNSGLQPAVYAHLSLGIVLLAYNIRNAIENQRCIYDFLRGNESYKYRMGAQDTRVYKLLARPNGSTVSDE